MRLRYLQEPEMNIERESHSSNAGVQVIGYPSCTPLCKKYRGGRRGMKSGNERLKGGKRKEESTAPDHANALANLHTQTPHEG